jgi:hypothetical protein
VNFTSAEAVEAAFYRAFSHGDVSMMAGLWLDSPGVSCIHPGRSGLHGYGPVINSWRAILEASDGFEIHFRLKSEFVSEELVVRVGTEHLRAAGKANAVLSVTNVFRRTSLGWSMVLHHAGPAHDQPAQEQALH